jgi:hypothetical protein
MPKDSEFQFFCQCCGDFRPVEPIKLERDIVIPENGIWSDVVCKDCHFVITTVSADIEGELLLVTDAPNS